MHSRIYVQISLALTLARECEFDNDKSLIILVQELNRLGLRLRRRYEQTCTFEWANTAKYLLYTEKLEKKIKIIQEEWAHTGIEIELQTDPRGLALTIRTPKGEYHL